MINDCLAYLTQELIATKHSFDIFHDINSKSKYIIHLLDNNL